MSKFVYLFNEGNAGMRNLLGGKGANLAEMTSLGLPVPQGFTVTTEACTKYYTDGKTLTDDVVNQIFEGITSLENLYGKKFGDAENPLLVSVRSGARASMPGMMDTILNLGLNDIAVEGLARLTDNPRFAYDSYRRFIQMFADVVMEIDKSNFEELFDAQKEKRGVKEDTELDADDLKIIVAQFKKKYAELKGEEFPQDPREQLLEAVKAVFRSWDNPRANVYRRLNNIPYEWGTAVNVQVMVFGNMGLDSGTGVAFSRNPSNGENELYGEYLFNAQGEDVVAGIRTPEPIANLKKVNPAIYEEFAQIAEKLEKHYRDMQDMEFTIERGKLFILQTRNGKRTAQAALRIAIDLVKEGLLTEEEAILKVEPKSLDALLHPQFDAKAIKKATPIAKGLNASPGAAAGKVVFTAERAKELSADGSPVILVRQETSPEDIEGMVVARGIVTARGGMTSHAAVVARGMGTCCVAGCGELHINEEQRFFECKGKRYNEGDWISIDGGTGFIYGEKIDTVEADVSGDFATLMEWADKYRALSIRTNADNPKDAETAIRFGAEGIGLCRTEHMFFESDRIFAMRQMIVAKNVEERRKALAKLLPIQRKDFEEIYRVLKGLPVTIRYLDPPLHEFLPHTKEEITELAEDLGITYEELKATIDELHEFNPMLGHRGCRLSVTYPEIAEMQTRAVIEAAINVTKEGNFTVKPEIMIPLVGEVKELEYIKKIVDETAKKVMEEQGLTLEYKVGTMIEIPRACLTADEIAEKADFFSFGTNDLTQMTFGFSRDDAGKFLEDYYDKKVFAMDPFAHVDRKGVGQLMKTAIKLGRSVKPDLKLGICGEHGGDPYSIEFCHEIGLDYVSCSPFRVPIARLAAAHANILNKRK
ncbi:MAG TPA: pyruvate, phosphate dikinase [Acholeplasmataceae bacterium]|nr:pyruvate, phosphate dikinase [Acholeplasmataceae bacterium]